MYGTVRLDLVHVPSKAANSGQCGSQGFAACAGWYGRFQSSSLGCEEVIE